MPNRINFKSGKSITHKELILRANAQPRVIRRMVWKSFFRFQEGLSWQEYREAEEMFLKEVEKKKEQAWEQSLMKQGLLESKEVPHETT